jgi:hypothetical protein
MEFLDERDAARAIRSGVGRSKRTVFAVAFWGAGAMERLGIDEMPRSMSIVCNLKMGATNPSEIIRLRDIGVDVRQCDTLHGKVYLFEDAVLIGSSNASSNGLGFQEGETSGWREANVLSREPALIEKAQHWIGSLPTRMISDDDLKNAQIAWNNLRNRSVPDTGGSLLEQLRVKPSYFDGRSIFLAVVSSPMDREGDAGVKTAKRELDNTIEAFQDWPNLPKQGYLISFWLGTRGGVSRDGLYERRLTPPDRTLGSGSTLQLCWPVDGIFGLKVPIRDVPGWAPICRALRRSSHWDPDGDCAWLNLADVARELLP